MVAWDDDKALNTIGFKSLKIHEHNFATGSGSKDGLLFLPGKGADVQLLGGGAPLGGALGGGALGGGDPLGGAQIGGALLGGDPVVGSQIGGALGGGSGFRSLQKICDRTFVCKVTIDFKVECFEAHKLVVVEVHI